MCNLNQDVYFSQSSLGFLLRAELLPGLTFREQLVVSQSGVAHGPCRLRVGWDGACPLSLSLSVCFYSESGESRRKLKAQNFEGKWTNRAFHYENVLDLPWHSRP